MTSGERRLDHPDGEPRWVRDRRWASVSAPSARDVLTAYEHLLVVAAHPDDECLGAGAFIADAASTGTDVTVLVLTDGEASHPRSPSVTTEAMGRRRRGEADRAAIALADSARVVHGELPDGSLAQRHDGIVAAVRDLVRPGTLVLAPWTADGHPDHDAAGRASAAAVAAVSSAFAESSVAIGHYLVWFWHWGTPDNLPWDDVVAVDASLDGFARREAALSQHHSQHVPLSSAPGDEVLLTDAVLAPSRRGFTTLVLPSHIQHDDHDAIHGGARTNRAATFDEMFDAGDDPWSSATFYERRKRALSLAVLQRESYGRVLDLGCSTGALTHELAPRSTEVVAIDVSKRALEVARRSVGGEVRWVHGEAPSVLDELDEGFDLVMVSELGYFLRPFELWLTVGRLLELLRDGGELVLVHWRHPTKDIPLDGPAVHAQVRAMCSSWSVLTHVEDDVLIDGYVVSR